MLPRLQLGFKLCNLCCTISFGYFSVIPLVKPWYNMIVWYPKRTIHDFHQFLLCGPNFDLAPGFKPLAWQMACLQSWAPWGHLCKFLYGPKNYTYWSIIGAHKLPIAQSIGWDISKTKRWGLKLQKHYEAITEDTLTSATVKDNMADTLGYAIEMLSRWVIV